MTGQQKIEGEPLAAFDGYGLKNSRLFMFFDIKERPCAGEPAGRKEKPSLRQRFLERGLASTRLAEFGGHPLIHGEWQEDAPLWREAGAEVGKGNGDRKQPVPGANGKDKKLGLIVADDLHPAVIEALGGRSETKAGRRLPALELTPAGLNLLNGQYLRPPGNPKDWPKEASDLFDPQRKGLCLALTPAAQTRLYTTATEILVTIVKANLVFPSHFGLVIVELEVRPPGKERVDARWIKEALHILSNRSRRRNCTLAAFKRPIEASLADLIAVSLPREHCDADPWNRLYSYTVLVLDQFSPADAEALAFRCARHYTKDYRLSQGLVSASVLRPFDSVIHVFSLEGAASVVDGSDKFLREQFASGAEHLYLWLVALAYHEHVYLIDLVQKQVPIQGGDDPDSKPMTRLVEDFLKFRLRHRMPLVSDLEMHNQVYGALRQSLRLDALSEKLATDAAAVESTLRQRAAIRAEESRKLQRARRNKSARHDAWASAGIVFGLTFLAFSALVEKLEKLIFPDMLARDKDLVTLVGAFVFAALGGLVEYRRRYREATDDARPEEDEGTLENAAEIGSEQSDTLRAAAAAGAVQIGHR